MPDYMQSFVMMLASGRNYQSCQGLQPWRSDQQRPMCPKAQWDLEVRQDRPLSCYSASPARSSRRIRCHRGLSRTARTLSSYFGKSVAQKFLRRRPQERTVSTGPQHCSSSHSVAVRRRSRNCADRLSGFASCQFTPTSASWASLAMQYLEWRTDSGRP
jgi:hypothetical protein